MSKSRIRALLDRPGPQSLGMLGVLVDRANEIHVEGLAGSRQRRLTETELNDLVAAGHARAVDGLEIEDSGREQAALWVGAEFASKSQQLGVPLPAMPKSSQDYESEGQYWIAPTTHVWRVIDSWVVRAFRRVVSEGNAELAALMPWAMPDRIETRAAAWITSDSTRRAADLEWWLRLERNEGQKRIEPIDLETSIKEAIASTSQNDTRRVLGFVAPATGGDKEVAQRVADELEHTTNISFGRWLRQKAVNEGREPKRRSLQIIGQRIIDEQGALSFCLDVLSQLPDHSLAKAKFVIEGIRHPEILDVLHCLVGDDHFMLVSVDLPRDMRIERLMRDENLSREDALQILDDATERRIPEVQQRATLQLEGKESVEKNAIEVVRSLAPSC